MSRFTIHLGLNRRPQRSDTARELCRSDRRNGMGRQEGRGTRFSGGSAGRPGPSSREILIRNLLNADAVPLHEAKLRFLSNSSFLWGSRTWSRRDAGLESACLRQDLQTPGIWSPQYAVTGLGQTRTISSRTSWPQPHVKMGNLRPVFWLFRLFHAHPMYWVSRL